MMKIKAKPEGREGIYLISKEEALKIIDSIKDDYIHNFIGGDNISLGCDWEKESVVDFIENKAERIAIITEPNLTMRHHLVGLTANDRYGFDIGEIKPEDIEIEGTSNDMP